MIYTMKRNDTYPPLKALLQMGNGSAIRIAGASVRMVITNENDEIVLNKVVTIDDEDNGIISYTWLPEDTATAGEYRGEFEITFGEGSILTVPNDGYFTLNIVQDLGGGSV